MFETSNSRRIKRSKIFSTSSSEDEGSESESKPATIEDQPHGSADIKVDYGFEYEFIDSVREIQTDVLGTLPPSIPALTAFDVEVEENNKDDQNHPSEPKEQVYEFLLFKPTPKTSVTGPTESITANKIVIRSPTPESVLGSRGPGSIIKPRPFAYYFTSHLPESTLLRLQSEYTSSALSPSQLQALSSLPWPGSRLPWRIMHIPRSRLISQPAPSPRPQPVSSLSKQTSVSGSQPTLNPHSPKPKRKKPSKKRRIALRRRIEDRKSLLEKSKLQDELEREKRTIRNREKKVKKKARDKKKKEDAKLESQQVQQPEKKQETTVDPKDVMEH